MGKIIQTIAAKQAELDRLRRRAPGGLTNLEHSRDIELTYTSNAIEGNTLTAAETTLVIEQGITVSGKKLRLHPSSALIFARTSASTCGDTTPLRTARRAAPKALPRGCREHIEGTAWTREVAQGVGFPMLRPDVATGGRVPRIGETFQGEGMTQ